MDTRAIMVQLRIFGLADDDDQDPIGEDFNGLRWAQIESGARVVWSADDAPMRALAPRSRRRVGKYNSIKAGRLLAHESRGSGYVGGEKFALMLCEIMPDVVDMRTQHLRFDLLIGGALHTYVPDIVRLMDDGSLEVVEVKKDDLWKTDEFYAEKIRLTAAVCAEVAVGFAVWTEKQMARTLRIKENVVAIQAARTVEYDEVDRLLLVRALKSHGGSATVGQLKAALPVHPRHIAEAIIRGMMCRRVLILSLNEHLGDETTATLFVGRNDATALLAA